MEVGAYSTGVLNALDGYCLNYINTSAQSYLIPARSGRELNAYLASGAVTSLVVTPTCGTPHCNVRLPGSACTIGFAPLEQ
jgi:hypothetical protein